MGRIRTIKPEFPQSESVGRLSREARLFFIQLWTIVDDEGRARGSSQILASLLYPYDGEISALVDEWVAETEREGMTRRYKVDGSTYIEVLNFNRHQKIERPSSSKLPEHSDSFGEDSSKAHRSLAEDSRGVAAVSVSVPVPVPVPVSGPGPKAVAPRSRDREAGAPPAARFACVGPVREWQMSESDSVKWAAFYPDVDVGAELRKMQAWLDVNPKKTANGMPRFVQRWLAKSQDERKNARGDAGFRTRDEHNRAALEQYRRGETALGDAADVFGIRSPG